MQMNSYLWSLYLKAGGQAVVDRFAAFERGDVSGFSAFVHSLVVSYCPDALLADDFARDVDEAAAILGQPDPKNDDTASEEGAFWTYADEADADWQWLRSSLPENLPAASADKEAFFQFCDHLVCFSVLAYAEKPGGFVPYFFQGVYNVLSAVAELFEIALPEMPNRKSYKERFRFYYSLCSVLTSWRETQEWSSAELCAFLYDFAPKLAGGTDWVWKTLPEPRAAFVVGTSPAMAEDWQRAGEGTVFSCQGNPDTQPGDLILLYQWAPTSALTSIWRAAAPGFIDPLFWHYRCIYIGNPRHIPPLSFQTMKNDPLLGQLALVKTRMLGMDGTELKPSQYNAILDVLREASDGLPRLANRFERDCRDGEIQTEHDVERRLLEPLLERLGWPREHYVRQMPLRMGRGSSVYPDYVLMPRYTPSCEKAFWVVEAKKSIPTERQLRIDCIQAASYAYRLDASGLMLVAQEGVWLAERKDDFGQLRHYTWAQLQDGDAFSQLFAIVGYRKSRRRLLTISAARGYNESTHESGCAVGEKGDFDV